MPVNEPTFAGHIKKLLHPNSWATQMELIAAATLFQVSIYYCTCVTNTFGNRKYQWEVVKPLAAANQFNYPHIVEDDPIHSAVIPHHFELVYYNNCHYDSVVMEGTDCTSSSPPQLSGTSDRDFTSTVSE